MSFPWAFPSGKESACNVGDVASIFGSGRSPGEGDGSPRSILAWRIPWTKEHSPWGCVELDTTVTFTFLMVLVVKNLPANAGDIKDSGSIPGWGRSPGGGHGNPL